MSTTYFLNHYIILPGRFLIQLYAVWILLVSGSVVAAPYPPDGLVTEWTQPDGTKLKLRVYGDEFYGRTTTDSGYTVLFDPKNMAYYYAEQADSNKKLTKEKTLAHLKPPHGIKKNLLENPRIASKIQEENIRKYGLINRDDRWMNRVRDLSISDDAPDSKLPSPSPQPTGESVSAPIVGNKIGLTILVEFPNYPETLFIDPVGRR